MSTTAIFVYGTLRPGDYNHDRFGLGGLKEVIRDCKVSGRLYHAFPSREGRIYPGARFDEGGFIVGDILVYESDCEALEHVVRMELGAGYSIVPLSVTLADGTERLSLGFQYERPHGSLIPSGDWFASDAYPTFLDEHGEDLDWNDDDWDEEDD